MAAQLFIPPSKALDANANPLSGAVWSFYETGTTTPLAVYADAGLQTSLGSTVTADSAGKFPNIYFDSDSIYRAILKNASGSMILHDIDPVSDTTLSSLTSAASAGKIGFSQDESYQSGSPGNNVTRWEVIATTNGQTSFSLIGSANVALLVSLNGATLSSGDYQRIGDNIVMNAPCVIDDVLVAIPIDGPVEGAFSVGTVGAKLQQFINPLDGPWAASGNGLVDDTTALAAADAFAYARGAPLYITGRHRVVTNTILLSDLIFIGGTIEPSSGVTVTCRGTVTSPPVKIFAGNGSVVGIRRVSAQWWGPAGNGVADDQPALQAAHDCVEQSKLSRGGRPTIDLAGGVTYGLGKSWRLRPSADIDLQVVGAGRIFTGTRFQPLASFNSDNGDALVWVEGQPTGGQQVVNLRIGNFGLLPRTGSTCTKAIQVGSPGKMLIGTQQSEIFDVFVSDEFPSGFPIGFYLGNFTLIDFNRCSSINRTLAGSVNVKFFCDSSTSFVGDINFNACRFTSSANGTNAKNVDYSGMNIAAAEAKGHRYNDCTFYTADKGVDLSCSAGAQVGDIWFNPGCQFDNFQGYAVYGDATGSGTVLDDVVINACYFRGSGNGKVAVYMRALSGARVDAVAVQGCWFANLTTGSRSVYIEGAVNVQVNDNRHTECDNSTSEIIAVTGAVGFSIRGNTLKQVTALPILNFITIGVGSDYGNVTGNTASGVQTGSTVNNLSSGTHLTLTPNW